MIARILCALLDHAWSRRKRQRDLELRECRRCGVKEWR